MTRIRDANPADESRVREVSRAAYQRTRLVYRPKLDLLHERGDPYRQSRVLVALVDDIIGGTVTYSFEEAGLHLRRLAVDPDFQRQGMARALVAEAEKRAGMAGASRLSLYTIRQTGNVPIFEHLGFSVVDEAPTDLFESDHYAELTEVRMEKRIC